MAAVAWLRAPPDGNGKLGVVGFCYGGGIVQLPGDAPARPARRGAVLRQQPGNGADVPRSRRRC